MCGHQKLLECETELSDDFFPPKTQERVSEDQFPSEKLGWAGTEKPCQGAREPRLESLQTGDERKFWLQILHPCMKRLRCQLFLTVQFDTISAAPLLDW